MLESLKIILEIQELDMKMLRLARLKKERQDELLHIESLRQDLKTQQSEKEIEIANLNENIQKQEGKIKELKEQIKKLDAKQSSIRKVEEFKALTQEMTTAERERVATEQIASDLIDKRNGEEEILEKIKQSLISTEANSQALEEEITNNIKTINKEGGELKEKREKLAKLAKPEFLKIYEKLFFNKRDRVVVPIENRTCSGCHIALTPQHENVVRKGERLIFCEHCSRILYWQESEALTGTPLATKKRRRRATSI